MSKWKVEVIENPFGVRNCFVGYDRHRLICQTNNEDEAEQIVREHNAHEELVNSLKAFVKNEGYDRKDIREMLVRNAESALHKAKGKE